MIVAKAEIERLSAETAKLNAALEQLETDKNAVEGRARTMEFVVYGAIIILIALLATISSILFVNRRRAIAANTEQLGPETKPSGVTGDSPVVGTQPHSEATDTISTSPALAQSLSSDATTPKCQGGSDGSGARSSSDAAEERVAQPI